jgi:hypothetical protein
MNNNIKPSFAAKKPPPAVSQKQQHHTPSAKPSVVFSFGSNAGTAKSSTSEKYFFKSPIAITTTTTATTTTTGQPLDSATLLDHLTKSDSSISLLEKVTSRSLVAPRAKKTRKVRTTWSSTVGFNDCMVLLSHLYSCANSSLYFLFLPTGRHNVKEEY